MDKMINTNPYLFFMSYTRPTRISPRPYHRAAERTEVAYLAAKISHSAVASGLRLSDDIMEDTHNCD